jgi:hypothetical protein
MPPDITVIVTFPELRPVTKPAVLTVAIVLSLDVHFTEFVTTLFVSFV